MRYFLLLILLFPFLSNAQETRQDSIEKSKYIEEYHRQLNIKFEVSNEKKDYIFPFQGINAKFTPNINFRYALGFNYRFVSVRVGIRQKVSDTDKQDKGESDQFRIKVKLLFTNWSHKLEYNYVRGYYVRNTDELAHLPGSIKNMVQFPNMKTNIYSGSTAYKFNKNYSVMATQSQTEIQKKSAGSFMPSIDYSYYKINDTREYINYDGELMSRDLYNNYKGFIMLANIGYYYTFVFKEHWYAFAYAAPGVGIDFYTVTTNTDEEIYSRSNNSALFSIQSGVAVGYNSKRYYFGADFNNQFTHENYGVESVRFNTNFYNFHVFVGYRFKPPKVVRKGVDYIQEKVPIIQDPDTKKKKA